MDRTKKALLNALFLVVTLGVNTLGALGFINGLSQKAISDMYVTLITPGPSTFSIWGIIYTLLIISIIAMIIKKNDPYYQNVIDRISPLFWISCLLNMAWIVSFSYVLLEISLIFILLFVIMLALICRQLLQIQERNVLLPLTFGLYTGWLFIASVVNTAAVLVKLNWNGFGISFEILAIITLVISVILIFLVNTKLKNAVFPLPVAWAFFGIREFLASPNGFNGEYGLLQIVALVGMAVLVGIAAIQLYINRFSLIPNPTD